MHSISLPEYPPAVGARKIISLGLRRIVLSAFYFISAVSVHLPLRIDVLAKRRSLHISVLPRELLRA